MDVKRQIEDLAMRPSLRYYRNFRHDYKDVSGGVIGEKSRNFQFDAALGTPEIVNGLGLFSTDTSSTPYQDDDVDELLPAIGNFSILWVGYLDKSSDADCYLFAVVDLLNKHLANTLVCNFGDTGGTDGQIMLTTGQGNTPNYDSKIATFLGNNIGAPVDGYPVCIAGTRRGVDGDLIYNNQVLTPDNNNDAFADATIPASCQVLVGYGNLNLTSLVCFWHEAIDRQTLIEIGRLMRSDMPYVDLDDL